MSKEYMIRIASKSPKDEMDIYKILSLPILGNLIFPSELLLDPKNETRILLENAEQFSGLGIPDWCRYELGINVSLTSKDNVYFSINIHFENSVSPSIINLAFSDIHLEKDLVGYTVLKDIIRETSSNFQISTATVYDTAIQNYRDRLKYFIGPDEESYPLEIGWISYFGKNVVEFLGREKFKNLQSHSEKIEFNGGFLIASVLEAFRAEEPQHRQREAQIIKDLELEKFAKRRKSG